MTGFGSVKKADISAVDFLDQREIMKQLVDITNEGASFALWMQWLGRYEKTALTNYHNFVNTELFSTETILNAAVTVHTAGTDITVRLVTASGASFFRVGEIIQIPSGATAIVKAKTADAGGDLVRLQSENGAALGLANGQVLSVVGSVAGEGGTFLESRKYFPTKRQNNIQIFDECIYESTDIQMVADIELVINGKTRYANKQEIEGMLVMMKNISNAFLFAQGTGDNFITTTPTHVDADGNAQATTKGLRRHIVEEGINLSSDINAALFANLKRQFDRKRIKGEFMVAGGSELDIAWDDFFYNFGGAGISDNSRWMIDGENLELGIKNYSLYNLTFRKMPMLALNEPNIVNFTGSAGYEKLAFILPLAPVQTVGGSSVDGIRCRYMELAPESGANASSNGKYRTTKHGRYAAVPTSEDRKLKVACETKQGIEVLNAPHCTLVTLP